jgi:hypothetical protein
MADNLFNPQELVSFNLDMNMTDGFDFSDFSGANSESMDFGTAEQIFDRPAQPVQPAPMQMTDEQTRAVLEGRVLHPAMMEPGSFWVDGVGYVTPAKPAVQVPTMPPPTEGYIPVAGPDTQMFEQSPAVGPLSTDTQWLLQRPMPVNFTDSPEQSRKRKQTFGPADYLGVDQSRPRVPSVDFGSNKRVRMGPTEAANPTGVGRPQKLPSLEQACVCNSGGPVGQRVKRPRNAFILFRQYNQKQIARELDVAVRAKNGGISNSEVSKLAGDKWKTLPDSEKERFRRLAAKEKEQHLAANPGYKYQPRKGKEAKYDMRFGTPSCTCGAYERNKAKVEAQNANRSMSFGTTIQRPESPDVLDEYDPGQFQAPAAPMVAPAGWVALSGLALPGQPRFPSQPALRRSSRSLSQRSISYAEVKDKLNGDFDLEAMLEQELGEASTAAASEVEIREKRRPFAILTPLHSSPAHNTRSRSASMADLFDGNFTDDLDWDAFQDDMAEDNIITVANTRRNSSIRRNSSAATRRSSPGAKSTGVQKRSPSSASKKTLRRSPRNSQNK